MLTETYGDAETFKAEEKWNNFEDSEDSKKFLKECKAHVAKNRKPLKRKRGVILTHPFFLINHHGDRLKGCQQLIVEAEQYQENLSKFLNFIKNRSNGNTVFFEDPEDYFHGTSALLEKGILDDVIFTQRMKGFSINGDYTKVIGFDELYFGGLYNGLCLSQSILGTKNKGSAKIYAIKELVLEGTYDAKTKGTLIPSEIIGVDQSNVLNLEEVIKNLERA